MVGFKLKTNTLRQTLTKMKVVLKSTALDKRIIYCEITVTNGKITLNSPGVTYTLEAETTGAAKIALPYLYIVNILKDHKEEEIAASAEEGWLTLGKVKVAAKTTFFKNDSILRSIDLPINYSDLDLLKIARDGYTPEELDFNKISPQIRNARNNMKEKIQKSYRLLKMYGVTYEEVEALVESKLLSKT